NTQFGARAQRSTNHALMILQEETFQAWRQGNILSLVTFDVQGAYNGVNKDILGNAYKEWEYTDASCDGSTASALIEKPRSPLAISTPLWLQSTNPVSPKAPRSPQFYTSSTTLIFSGPLWLPLTNLVSPKAPRSPQFYTSSTTLIFSGELSPQRTGIWAL
ncbi:hypothetical protein V502_01149, partial [Pseudogymnoascus sp. VKM F-4520 (FW-2644)]